MIIHRPGHNKNCLKLAGKTFKQENGKELTRWERFSLGYYLQHRLKRF